MQSLYYIQRVVNNTNFKANACTLLLNNLSDKTVHSIRIINVYMCGGTFTFYAMKFSI